MVGSGYNIIILEYMLSHFFEKKDIKSKALFNELIEQIILKRKKESPLLIIINDIDHYEVRNNFDPLIEVLINAGYKEKGVLWKKHFSDRNGKDYNDNSERYSSCGNKFSLPYNDFDCAIRCSSAQLIIELEM